ncbi:uncharacterized protein LOC119097111 [Pollicipes pollicipes]|uniref:uncharacterized protein LOC119097111 n=1 Tax=Pollicipes pollicipes TaxID=41117 RepID=UPI001885639A|nr:uncharacterized protein LOC119097111 [Pollicipes pollicipes]
MIVRDEVRSEEGGSGGDDDDRAASPSAQRTDGPPSDVVRASREREQPLPGEVWNYDANKETWVQKPEGAAADQDGPESASGSAAPGAAEAAASGGVEVAPAGDGLQAESLSDFSDDADEILNREDEVVEEEITFEDDSGHDGERPGSRGSAPAAGARRRPSADDRPRDTAAAGAAAITATAATATATTAEEDEEEADGVDPPEARPQSLVDALAIDWSSLVSAQPRRPAPPPPGSALERFSAAAVFSQLGVCADWAGPELMQTVRQHCGAPPDSEEVPSEPVPSAAECQRRYRRRTEQAITDPGPHRRALCARADLAIRRHLCDVTETEPMSEAVARASFKRDTFAKHLALLTARVS